jgi:hypothetical protein
LSSNTYTATLHDDWCIGSGKLPREHQLDTILHVRRLPYSCVLGFWAPTV